MRWRRVTARAKQPVSSLSSFLFRNPPQTSISRCYALFHLPLYSTILGCVNTRRFVACSILVKSYYCFIGGVDGEAICRRGRDYTLPFDKWIVSDSEQARPALLQHPRTAKPSSFLVFTIYHQSVQGFPTSPLSRRHLNGSWLMMENPESDEKGEKY